MKNIKFSSTDLTIVPIIFGGNVFGWTLDEKESFQILNQFTELGFNAIDTANSYSHWVPGNRGGESESIIGKWMYDRKNRHDLVVMTKVGGRFSDNPNYNTSRSHILEQVDLSLKRLKTDYIDVYQTHYDQEEIGVEETLRTYEDLVRSGKVRYIGASNISADRLKESLDFSREHNLPAYISLQPEYNLYSRAGYENNYRQIAHDYTLAVIPYYSLASGFLTGKYQNDNDFLQSVRSEGIKEQYWNERGQKIVKTLIEVANKHEKSPSAIALAWLLHQDTVAAPIASATKTSHLDAFVDAVDLELDNEDLIRLNDISNY
ncbi:aldo/keto reductase [Sphingobacterium sp. UT-1RO-CII-1]|uniref:aldo/keto reductase n=1 Tax=Sphingobacterium sp. UT-1RO-CII-1 TaxID=2995225 RepID=UPI00227A3847|nr:aldo/keto reductase [Sphingobacterium sp. UT-1RO-CII-1]MCY4779183.1 aldo/keto reductase [Sphingobacterium sp. UT-1RO-CII-1]